MQEIKRGAIGYLYLKGIELEIKNIIIKKISNNKWKLNGITDFNWNSFDLIKYCENCSATLYIHRFVYNDILKITNKENVFPNGKFSISFEVINKDNDRIKIKYINSNCNRQIDLNKDNDLPTVNAFKNEFLIRYLSDKFNEVIIYLDKKVENKNFDEIKINNIIKVEFKKVVQVDRIDINIDIDDYKLFVRNKSIYKYFKHKFVFESYGLECIYKYNGLMMKRIKKKEPIKEIILETI